MLMKLLILLGSLICLLVFLFIVYSLFFYKVMTDETFDDREHY